VAYDSRLVTREETPGSLQALVRQRTRWNQGYLQVLRKTDWRGLPRSRRVLAVYTLGSPFIQAVAFTIVPVSVVTIAVLALPVGLALLSFVPLIPILTTLGVEIVGLGDFCREYGYRRSPADVIRLLVSAIPYQLVLGWAAARAVIREARGVSNWEKTDHAGAHL
jgi:cellulose synthase/poly-beta-1,6-N-acetylglucosamine synthase-like glycosyltransferase